MNISSCLIVKNGGDEFITLLHQLLEFSNEVIVVDTGSNKEDFDKYSTINDERLKVFTFDWIDDFAKARNYSFSKATCDWIFWCDADDVLTDGLINTLKTIEVPDKYNAVILNYEFSKDYFVPRKRLLRKSALPIWYDRIHEYVVCNIPGEELDMSDTKNGYINHEHRSGAHTERNLRIFRDMIDKKEPMTPRNLLYYANELFDHKEFEEALNIYDKVLTSLYDFDAWNALVKMYNLCRIQDTLAYWLMKALQVASRMDMRGDVCYLIGITYRSVGNIDQCKAWLARALNVVATGLDCFGEDIYMSKYLPAVTLREIFKAEGSEEQVKIMDELVKRFATEYNLSEKMMALYKEDK